MVMAIAEDMKKLAENIIASHDVRVRTLSNLASDTHRTVEGFAVDRKKMAAKQAKELAGFTSGLSKDVQGLLKNAQDMVREFYKSNMQMGKEQAKRLADFVNDLTNNVGSMMDGFHKSHGEMSKHLRSRLAKEIKGIQTEVENILNDADRLIGEYSEDMTRAKKAWQSMSAVLAKAREAGIMPDIKTGEKVTTVKKAVGKARGKK